MLKIFRILGKKCRFTIPKPIRIMLGIRPNDIFSFTVKDERTIILKKEIICDENCSKHTLPKGNLTHEEAKSFVNNLSANGKRALLVVLTADWASEKDGAIYAQ